MGWVYPVQWREYSACSRQIREMYRGGFLKLSFTCGGFAWGYFYRGESEGVAESVCEGKTLGSIWVNIRDLSWFCLRWRHISYIICSIDCCIIQILNARLRKRKRGFAAFKNLTHC